MANGINPNKAQHNERLQNAIDLYVSGLSMPEVSEITGVARSTLGYQLKKRNLARSCAEGMAIAVAKGRFSHPAYNRLKIEGKVFGRLKVISPAGFRRTESGESKSIWECQCECGSTHIVDGSALTSGNTKSCGCLSLDSTVERSTKHGQTGTRTYRIWQAILNRCRNKNTPGWHRYGGRGITVTELWKDFDVFLNDMGEAPDKHSIDRINNDGPYSPENCRWVTPREQALNRSTNRLITFNSKTKCLIEWAEDLGIDQSSLRERLDKWDLERALNQPKRTN